MKVRRSSGIQDGEKMTVHAGMRVELVADETQFPELINPVQLGVDTRGRLWAATWATPPAALAAACERALPQWFGLGFLGRQQVKGLEQNQVIEERIEKTETK